MNRKTWALIAGAILLAIAIWFYATSGTEPASDPDGNEAIADHGGAASEGLVALTPDQIDEANIAVEQVTSGAAVELVFPATVAARPDSIATIDARASGVVRSVHKTLGDYVRRGEAVARIESAEAASLAAARAAARARVNELAAIYDRERRLFDQNVTARQDLEAAQANLSVARSELTRAEAAAAAAGVGSDGRSLSVTSPLSGRVTAAPVTLGSYVNAGDELYRVVNPNGLQIEVAVPAADIARVRPGDVARFDLPGGGSASARVRSVTPSLDAENRTALAILSPRRALPGLQPGTFIEVRLQTSGETDLDRLAVPEDAVQTVGGEEVVFIRVENGFRVQPVQIGSRSAGMVTILSGIRLGQRIATENAFLLKSELEKEEAGDEH